MFHQNKEKFLINIEGLPKEEVIIALYKNVYRKSKASKYTYTVIADQAYYGNIKVPIGTDYPPSEAEVRRLLWEVSELKKIDCIDYLGPVNFKMDFSKHVINTKDYDTVHETDATPDIKTAKECIDELKIKYGIIKEKNNIEILKNFSKEISSTLIKYNYFKFKNNNYINNNIDQLGKKQEL